MNKAEWLGIVEENWDDLKDLVLGYHPRASYDPPEMPITAPRAEAACEVIRKQIAEEGKPITWDDLERMKTEGDVSGLSSAFSASWFGIPESLGCWTVPGFRVLCDLLDDPVEEEEDGIL